MFDWDRFKKGEIAVHCDTEEKAKDFLKECKNRNINWLTGRDVTQRNNWESYKKDTCYCCFDGDSKLGYSDYEFYIREGKEIIKWEVKEMKELTFKEVIANIKEGEVWESNEKTITIKYDQVIIQVKEGYEGRVNGNERMALSLDKKYKLQRKKYTFEEAFKAYEEGKEIESESYKYKKCNRADCFKLIRSIKDEWIKCEDGFEIHLDEIRGKWYIND